MKFRILTRRWSVFMLGCSLLTAPFAASSVAQTMNGDVKMGQELAQNWCGDCHAVDAQHAEARGAAPSFLSIAKMPSTTAISLHVFLQTPHERMPNLQLTKSQIDDVVAYILSLQNP